MPDVSTLEPSDIVTLHINGRQYRAMYQCHNDKTAIIEVFTSPSDDTNTFTLHVDWRDIKSWIADRRTDEAFYLPTDDPQLEGEPPERE